MSINILFEDEHLDRSSVGDVIRKIVAEANEIKRETHAALDHVRSQLQRMGFWAYRGGYHVAIHYQNDHGEPEQHRLAIITE